ncbi:Ribosomal RNA large subunit methyltransferase I [Nitrospira sp. KM1]|uniref:class I SAM-dependent rRNA methyltransferase n=1 Tax=Nitrospira sp. KM1 TaxID=1936990 RepID=UPI0013A79F80|nr:class I SAM-dependent rRNA methyltransferase [Nitrospira sp. KM1]BCA53966.1 Ribosomal RNA large subunit methyltransferase I [Nitrospira sp. KM1]
MSLIEEKPVGRAILTREKEIVGTRHPWIYAGFVQRVSGDPKAGDLIDLHLQNGRFYARGFFNPDSKIRVRILSFNDTPVTPGFWRERIAQADRLRRRIVSGTNAYRVIYGEADLLPGLIVDRYDDVLVMQTLSAGMDRRKDLLAGMLCDVCGVTRIYMRNDAKSRMLEGLPLETGFVRGSGSTTVEVHEGPARFVVNVSEGQKTGWFCDQRENRMVAARIVAGAHVLEGFCHTGAFGIHAALEGASSVTGIDVSAEALSLARRHAAMNGVETRCSYHQGDAFEEMRRMNREGERYDVVFLDPPAFARSKQAVPKALAGYKDVNLLGIRLTKPDGILVTSSCSHHVSEEAFKNAIYKAAYDAKRQLKLLELRGQGRDHPILPEMPETRYLKCLLFHVA